MALEVVKDEEGRWCSEYLKGSVDAYELCGHCLRMQMVYKCCHYPSIDPEVLMVMFRCSHFIPKEK